MSEELLLSDKPHRRLNILTGEWILVSPHRSKRPWQGQMEYNSTEEKLIYDEHCYLCPGNLRANGERNPDYKNTFVFTNDFAALIPNADKYISNDELLDAQSTSGTCRVICYSPKHNLTLADMKIEDIRKVISLWIDQLNELGSKYKWVQIFENKGEIMGSSNPHPHGQIWALDYLPNEIVKENYRQSYFFTRNNSNLLLSYLKRELELKERIVVENKDWAVLVPFWALWPFETILISKRHVLRMNELDDEEKNNLAIILKELLTKYDKLFNVSFPYSMGWHGAPFGRKVFDYWRLHAHFYPPLLRSATVKKFMVGFEMLAEAQRDLTPETAAAMLREIK